MIKNKINFVTGETYTLEELFSGNRRIIIPDLQRDYCWGDRVHTEEKKELVSGFVNNLTDQFDNTDFNDFLNLGLLYGYEAPTNHIQLCDGQQRIMTLYLLLGMLNRKTEENFFRKYLISDYEYLQDDKEPYLQYSIRESSLYFLSDLVCHFFIKEKEDKYFVDNCKDIKKSPWFFNDYKYDPSIQSMIRALSVIDEILKAKDKDWCREFGAFITTRLTFMYYDMENRKNGEETFVVINTTGEPLSNAQNLKPLVLKERINENNKEMPKQWEEIETWFWQKRKNGNDTADAGFNEFLRWVTMLESDRDELKRILSEGTYTFPHECISFEDIYAYWEIVKFLFDNWEYNDFFKEDFLSPSINGQTNTQTINQIDCFLLLPIIAYCQRWGIPKDVKTSRNLLRLCQFVKNLTRNANIGRDVNSLVFDVVFIANACKDIIELIQNDIENKISKIILSEENRKKLEIYSNSKELRENIEDVFWEVEQHPYTKGSVICIWSDIFKNSTMAWKQCDLDSFKNRFLIFKKIFSKENTSIPLSSPPHQGKIDNSTIARTILACNEDHTCHVGGRNYCCGYESYWEKIISEKPNCISVLIDKLSCASDDIYSGMLKVIEKFVKEFDDNEKKQDSRYYIVKYPNSLQALDMGYNILTFYDEEWDYSIHILNKTNQNSYHINLFVYLLYKQLEEKNIVKNQWLSMRNGLQLYCGNSHDWIVKKDDETPISQELCEKVSQKLDSKYTPILCGNEIQIPIDTKEDLIEEGIKILKMITEI